MPSPGLRSRARRLPLVPEFGDVRIGAFLLLSMLDLMQEAPVLQRRPDVERRPAHGIDPPRVPQARTRDVTRTSAPQLAAVLPFMADSPASDGMPPVTSGACSIARTGACQARVDRRSCSPARPSCG